MYLEEIIDDIQMESDRFECKGMLNRDDVIGWLKSIAGFANASGGISISVWQTKQTNWLDSTESLIPPI